MVACSVLGNECHRLPLHMGVDVLPDTYEGIQYPTFDEGENKTTLQPFSHQVSGHVTFMCPDEFHLFKPYCEKEANFYKTIPPEIAEFTPAFCGEVKLKMQNGCESFAVLPSTSFVGGRQQCGFCKNSKVSLLANNSVKYVPTKIAYRDARSGVVNGVNPWAKQCRLRPKKGIRHHFIILENITRFYQFPCVLDLKIGTRQHGDGVNEDKVMKFLEKCERSTSKKHGIRIGGMQYYDSTTSMFQCSDKYHGEALNYDQMQELILNFFSDSSNNCLRRNLCIRVIKRLEELKKALSSVDGCRLFGASLLIAYDGDPNISVENKDSVRLCLIDFARATWKGVNEVVQYSNSDEGVLLGVDTLLTILKAA